MLLKYKQAEQNKMSSLLIYNHQNYKSKNSILVGIF